MPLSTIEPGPASFQLPLPCGVHRTVIEAFYPPKCMFQRIRLKIRTVRRTCFDMPPAYLRPRPSGSSGGLSHGFALGCPRSCSLRKDVRSSDEVQAL
jgi:hypothetical protein